MVHKTSRQQAKNKLTQCIQTHLNKSLAHQSPEPSNEVLNELGQSIVEQVLCSPEGMKWLQQLLSEHEQTHQVGVKKTKPTG